MGKHMGIGQHKAHKVKTVKGQAARLTLNQWPKILMDAVCHAVPVETIKASVLCTDRVAMSTQFSGMGTAEHALQVIKDVLPSPLQCKIQCTSACDIDKTCQRILGEQAGVHACCMGLFMHAQAVRGWPGGAQACNMYHVSPLATCPTRQPGCVFADILDCVQCSDAQFYRARTVESKTKLMLSKVQSHNEGWCTKRQQYCPFGVDDIMVAGSPCVDYSRIGLRAGTSGFSLKLWLVSLQASRGTGAAPIRTCSSFVLTTCLCS